MDEDPLLNYYNQSQRSWSGPQIDPALIAAANRMQYNQQPAQPAQPAQQPQQAQPSTIVLSSQNQPSQVQDTGNVLFPYDAYEMKRNSTISNRAQATVIKNQELTKLAGQKKETYDAWDNYYKSIIDQKFPEVVEWEKKFPQIEDLAKEVRPLVEKRNTWISGLAAYSSQSDVNTKRPDETEEAWAARIAPQLLAQLKLYNTALAGSSDALSSQEVSRLVGGELNEGYLGLGNIFKPNAYILKNNLPAFKDKIDALHDILLNQVNDGYNTVAVQASPKYANQALGFPVSNYLSRDTSLRRSMRVDESADKSVIEGKMTMSQFLSERVTKYNEDQRASAQKAINDGAPIESVRERYKQKTGLNLYLGK